MPKRKPVEQVFTQHADNYKQRECLGIVEVDYELRRCTNVPPLGKRFCYECNRKRSQEPSRAKDPTRFIK